MRRALTAIAAVLAGAAPAAAFGPWGCGPVWVPAVVWLPPPPVLFPCCPPPMAVAVASAPAVTRAEATAPAPAPARPAPRIVADPEVAPPPRPAPAAEPIVPAPKPLKQLQFAPTSPAPPPEGDGRDSAPPPFGLPDRNKTIPSPNLPTAPNPAPAAKPADAGFKLPPLRGAPDGGGDLAPLELPGSKKQKANSSPLANGPRFDVVPVAGPSAGARVTVGFFNLSGRELALTVEGETVTLPGKGYVTATLPRAFRWSAGGADAETTRVPADAAGVEVVIRR